MYASRGNPPSKANEATTPFLQVRIVFVNSCDAIQEIVTDMSLVGFRGEGDRAKGYLWVYGTAKGDTFGDVDHMIALKDIVSYQVVE